MTKDKKNDEFKNINSRKGIRTRERKVRAPLLNRALRSRNRRTTLAADDRAVKGEVAAAAARAGVAGIISFCHVT